MCELMYVCSECAGTGLRASLKVERHHQSTGPLACPSRAPHYPPGPEIHHADDSNNDLQDLFDKLSNTVQIIRKNDKRENDTLTLK